MTALAVDPAGTGVTDERARAHRGASTDARRRLRLAAAWTWPTLLVVSVYVRFGGTGLVSPDDGFILAESRRILSGQVPHRDFITPRPAGSALLHCIDFLLPMPLLSASRLVSAVEVVAYTLLFASLAFRRPLREWSVVQVVAASAAVFVNLHSFPLMAWHTIDGALLLALGVVALRRGLHDDRARLATVGLLLLGGALVVKQSFAPALVLGVAMVWDHRRRADEHGRGCAVSLRRAITLVVLPIVAYVVVIALAGGLGPMVVQIGHARGVYGWSLVRGLWRRGGEGSLLLSAAAVLCLVDARAGRTPAMRACAGITARLGLTALVAGVLLATRTDPNDAWGRALLFLLVVVVVWEWLAHGFVDRLGVVMIAIAWMVSLSWGYPSPRLIAGSIALLVVDRVWRDAPEVPARVRKRVARVAAAVAVVVSVAVTATAINERARLDAQSVTGDGTIGASVPALRGVSTDLTTSTLIRDVAACRARFPADRVAVLPGPAIVVPVMHLDNPFSVDWLYPLEIRGSEHRLVDEARRLDAAGDYLVLVASDADRAANPVLGAMVDELTGSRTLCGGFTAIHSP
jgi:nitrate reductase NapE component